jgi:hypothetical protein
MTTHLIKPGTNVSDMRLRCGLTVVKAPKNARLGSEDGIDAIDCAGCLRDLVVDMRLADLGPMGETPEGRWLAGGDTGTSSITIWSVMRNCSMPYSRTGDRRRPSPPRDPDDFGRCHRLLETIPAWRSRMPEVADAHPEWADLVAAWDELTALYLEELPSGEAPRLYARMEALR